MWQIIHYDPGDPGDESNSLCVVNLFITLNKCQTTK